MLSRHHQGIQSHVIPDDNAMPADETLLLVAEEEESLVTLVCRSKLAKKRNRRQTRAFLMAAGLVLFYYVGVRKFYQHSEQAFAEDGNLTF